MLPATVILGLTSRCQLRCKMCIEHAALSFKRPKISQDIEPAVLAKILPIIYQAKKLVLGGVGEPLLYRNLISFLKDVREHNPKLVIEMYTNGQLLDSYQTIEAILTTIDILHISLNAWDNYEQLMVGARWPRITKNLELVSEIKKTIDKKTLIWLDMVMLKDGYTDVEKMLNWASELAFTGVICKDLWIMNEYTKQQSIRADQTFLKKVQVYLKQQKKYAKEKSITLAADELLDKAQKKEETCTAPWDMVQIAEDGRVLLCCNGYTLVGNLKSMSFDEVWNGKISENYRKGIKQKKYYAECKKCKIVSRDQFVRKK